MEELNYKALLIGNGVFQKDPHNLPQLKGPKNDLRVLEQTLTHPQVGLFEQNDITLLLDQPRGSVTREIERFFADSGRDDQLLFYYSGHGMLDTFNHLYLCAADTETSSLISTAISDEIINSMIRQSASSRIVIILDCCHSGRFKGGMPDNLRGEGRFVLTSTRARELAVDAVEADAPSVFTRFMTEALLSGEVDTNKDGYVSINEVYNFVLDRIVHESKQRPQRKFDETVGEVALGRCLVKSKTKSTRTRSKANTGGQHPRLNVSETIINITDVEPSEELPEEIIDVFNEGEGELDWTVETDQDWIELEQHDHYFSMHFSPRPGTNRARVLVRDKGKGGSKRVQIKIQVNEGEREPELTLSETSIDFGEVSVDSQRPSHSIRIGNEGGGELKPKVIDCDEWISAKVRGDILEVRADTDEIGYREGRIALESRGGNVDIPVTIEIGEGPVLSVNPSVINFLTVAPNTKDMKTIEVENSGEGRLSWKYETTGDFFSVKKRKASLEVSLQCAVPGNHNGAIVITSNGGELTVPIRVKVKGQMPAQQAPAAAGPDISGAWYAPGAVVEFSGGANGQYQFVDKNEMGIVVGQGVAIVAGNLVTFNGNHAVFGPYSGVFTLTGNQMVGQASMQGQQVNLTLQRGSPAGSGNLWSMIGQMLQ